jgi:hypothetical protein
LKGLPFGSLAFPAHYSANPVARLRLDSAYLSLARVRGAGRTGEDPGAGEPTERNLMAVYAKAILGAALAGLTTLGTVWSDGEITGYEWVGVAVAVIGVGLGVRQIPNKAQS